jgi:hypothetical protein
MKATVRKSEGWTKGYVNTYRGPSLTQVHPWFVDAEDGKTYGPYYPKRSAEQAARVVRFGVNIDGMDIHSISSIAFALKHGFEKGKGTDKALQAAGIDTTNMTERDLGVAWVRMNYLKA